MSTLPAPAVLAILVLALLVLIVLIALVVRGRRDAPAPAPMDDESPNDPASDAPQGDAEAAATDAAGPDSAASEEAGPGGPALDGAAPDTPAAPVDDDPRPWRERHGRRASRPLLGELPPSPAPAQDPSEEGRPTAQSWEIAPESSAERRS